MNNGRPSGPQKDRRWFKGGWLVLFILLIAVGAVGLYFWKGPGSMQASMPSAVNSQGYTSPTTRGDLRISTAASGKLVAYQSVDLRFSSSGTVLELNVKNGDLVETGQVLARMEDTGLLSANLSAAKLQVLNAQKTLTDLHENAGLSLAQSYADLVAAQDAYQSAMDASQRMAYARCGENTAIRLTENLKRASTQLANIRAEKANSEAYIASKQAYDNALANYNQCAAYSSDEKAVATSDMEVAKTALDDAQDRYDTLKATSGIDPNALALAEANLKLAHAGLAKAEEDLSGLTLIAPVGGKITFLAGAEGERAGTDTFITIVDTTRAALEINVDESDMSRLVPDALVVVYFDALPEQSFTGKVIEVSPEIAISGQYRVVKGVVELDKSAVDTLSSLPLGLSATVTLNPQEAINALLIPTIALQKQSDGSYTVTVVDSEGQRTSKAVTVGIYDKDYAEITSGLREGEQVSTGMVQFVAAGSMTSSSSLKDAQNTGDEFPGAPGGFPEGGPGGGPMP